MAKGIFVITDAAGELGAVGPFEASTSIAQFQKAQIFAANWHAAQMKAAPSEVPKWWIVEKDVPADATTIEIPLKAPGA